MFGMNVFAYSHYINDHSNLKSDSLSNAVKIAQSGMLVQSERMKVAAHNIANAKTTSSGGINKPYRRKIIYFKNEYNSEGVELLVVDRIAEDKSDFIPVYDPGHPAADLNGYVMYPNVNTMVEIMDAKEAQQSFAANEASFKISRALYEKNIEMLS